ncbi:MAG: preprotein translocase subunit SecA [Rickettsiales bacterium]|jgi:preprotein translocase subunit SecA
MFGLIAKKFFGSVNDRNIKSLDSDVQKINGLEPEISALSDVELKAKTTEFKDRLKKVKPLTIFYVRLLLLCAKLQKEF